jgi:hypothetical protein
VPAVISPCQERVDSRWTQGETARLAAMVVQRAAWYFVNDSKDLRHSTWVTLPLTQIQCTAMHECN